MATFFRRNIWLIPLAFALAFGAVGWTSYRALAIQMKSELADELRTTLNAEVAALEIWAEENEAVARVQAADPRVRAAATTLAGVAVRSADPRAGLLAAPAQGQLRAQLREVLAQHRYSGFAVIEPSGMILASDRDEAVGTRPRALRSLLDEVLEGKTVTTQPLAWSGPDAAGEAAAVMLVGTPLAEGRGAAALALSIRPDAEFKRLLVIARPRESGETYAFNADGLLVSRSRFEPQLRQIGLLPADESVTSFMNLQIRDPGGNLAEGYAPQLPLRARPLTRAAAGAVSGQDGVDVEGYRDYRGIPVAGAWAWIPTLGIGIATEMDIDEAYAGLTLLRTRFGVVVGLLVLAALAMFLYSFVMVRLRREVDEARQLGRYRIERKLGSGGVGTVYLASHALLRRPTAIKVLKAGVAGVEGVARFEREVQVTSSLSHPNTIEIYDFGYTPDGTFYYAMEYLRGLTLGECVEDDGPQPEARVLHLMKQACASIAEAHAAGLIHRDLKPSNVMLCERGGLFDFVKVLDFGLVRAEQQSREVALTAVDSLTGTPLYMPPEAVQAPDTLDARADVYQLGEILYYLLTGRHVFVGDTAYDVLAQHVASVPEAPSAALGRSVSPDLERIVLWCLEKKPAARPRDAGSLLEALEGCAATGTWGRREAQDWWRIWRERHPGSDDLRSTPGGSTPSSYGIDLAARLRDT